MQKFLLITLFALLSAITAAAQTSSEQKPLEGRQAVAATRVEAARSATAPPVVSGTTKKGGQDRQVVRIVDGRVLRVGPTTTYIKNGLSMDEVVRLLGKPETVSERAEGGRLLTVYTFPRSDGRTFVAEFENQVLVNSRTEPAASGK